MTDPFVRKYTIWEGNYWRAWSGRVVRASDMPKPSGTAQQDIDGTSVHALWFSDGRKWDCINGWRGDQDYSNWMRGEAKSSTAAGVDQLIRHGHFARYPFAEQA